MKTDRIVFLDYLRVFACFLVILVHASENYYGAGGESDMAGPVSFLANEADRLWVSIYDGFSRMSVPLFFIVSAFLLAPMPAGMTSGQFYKRRFLHILPPFFIFVVLYSTLPLLWGQIDSATATTDLSRILLNFPTTAGHFWFMYPLISIYLIIPIVSPWLERATAKEERIFLGLFAFSTFMPWLHRFVSDELWGECFWNGFHALWYCSGYLGYLVLAHYIRFHLDWSAAKRVRIGLLCFVVGAAFTAWSFWWKGVPGVTIDTPMLEWSWEFCTPNVLLATAGLFVAFTAIQRPAPRIVTGIAKLSFGMYLMHLFFLAPIAAYYVERYQVEPLFSVWFVIPVIAVLSYICCAVTTKVLSLLPGSRWIVG